MGDGFSEGIKPALKKEVFSAGRDAVFVIGRGPDEFALHLDNGSWVYTKDGKRNVVPKLGEGRSAPKPAVMDFDEGEVGPNVSRLQLVARCGVDGKSKVVNVGSRPVQFHRSEDAMMFNIVNPDTNNFEIDIRNRLTLQPGEAIESKKRFSNLTMWLPDGTELELVSDDHNNRWRVEAKLNQKDNSPQPAAKEVVKKREEGLVEIAGYDEKSTEHIVTEDGWLVDSGRAAAAIFDGVSTGGNGRLATKLASEEIAMAIKNISGKPDLARGKAHVIDALTQANAKIVAEVDRNPRLMGMGTTGDMVLVVDDPEKGKTLLVGHIGDGRVYHFIKDEEVLVRLTCDHGWARINYGVDASHAVLDKIDDVRDGADLAKLNPVELDDFHKRSAISDNLGKEKGLKLDLITQQVKSGDLVLMVTDAVYENLSPEKIREVLIGEGTVQEKSKRLVQMARDHAISGGFRADDNDTTAVVMKVK